MARGGAYRWALTASSSAARIRPMPPEMNDDLGIEGLEDDAEGGLSSAYVRGRFNASRAASTDA
jgi:hypothetical protein